jgi:hypothetical protein
VAAPCRDAIGLNEREISTQHGLARITGAGDIEPRLGDVGAPEFVGAHVVHDKVSEV